MLIALPTPVQPLAVTAFKVQAFRCTQVSGSQYGGQWRCVSGAKAFRFEFKD